MLLAGWVNPYQEINAQPDKRNWNNKKMKDD